jgi:homoserine dehydrogenase
VADIADIAKGIRSAPFGLPVARLTKSEKIAMQRHEGGYYIRVLAVDKPGTAATIARLLADENISIESIMQRRGDAAPHGGDDPATAAAPVPVILITYATTEDAVRRALAAVEAAGVVADRPQLIRIEKT